MPSGPDRSGMVTPPGSGCGTRRACRCPRPRPRLPPRTRGRGRGAAAPPVRAPSGRSGSRSFGEQAAVEDGRVAAPAAPGRDDDVGRPLVEARRQRPHRGAPHQRMIDRADGASVHPAAPPRQRHPDGRDGPFVGIGVGRHHGAGRFRFRRHGAGRLPGHHHDRAAPPRRQGGHDPHQKGLSTRIEKRLGASHAGGQSAGGDYAQQPRWTIHETGCRPGWPDGRPGRPVRGWGGPVRCSRRA